MCAGGNAASAAGTQDDQDPSFISARCRITFNTSSLTLSGTISGQGDLRITPGGTEVAVFSFNSIYLGPEVDVVVVGQRALCLVSKTTAIINTTISANPGTLGGFRGGESVARLPGDLISDDPRVIFICTLGAYCSSNATNMATVSECLFVDACLSMYHPSNWG